MWNLPISREKALIHSCRDCHFLTKISRGWERDDPPEPWSDDERNGPIVAGEREKTYLARTIRFAKCHKGIWQLENPVDRNQEIENELNKNRGCDCFFIEFSEGMDFDSATELYKKRTENRQFQKSLSRSNIAIWIAAISLVVGFVSWLF